MTSQDPTSPLIHEYYPNREFTVEEFAQLLQLMRPAPGAQAGLPGPDQPVLPLPEHPTFPPVVPVPVLPIEPHPFEPIKPIPIYPYFPKRNVSGRYRCPGPYWQLELRVDVDGSGPTGQFSGDFFSISGATTSYFGSFVVSSPTVTMTSTQVTVRGLGTFTFSAGAPVVEVVIPRTILYIPPAAATVNFYTTSNLPGATYVCPYENYRLRTVFYEQDYEQGVTLFSSYDTGSLPSGGAARLLSVVNAYAEAKIEMVVSPATDLVPTAEAGANAQWSNSELHAAMVKHFSAWADVPQWKVWLLAAYAHEYGPGLYGIMFDQQGKQRQGCAVFHQGIGGTTPDKLRLQLYTYVHELGHCFNLLHSWQKSLANPPGIDRPSALSWMNYPWNYPGGAAAFWAAFPFQFDGPELIHLRHGFRNNVIMGGNDFAVGSALQAIQDPQAFAAPIEDHSGLKLELNAVKDYVALGEPVVVEIHLRLQDTARKAVHTALHPNLGFVKVGIYKPDGQLYVYEPLLEHCLDPDIAELTSAAPALHESAYIGYGKGGHYFNQPGMYRLRAFYRALDGSIITSNIITLRVRVPMSLEDETVSELFLGEDQGVLLYLLGSDADELQPGNDAFDKVIQEHGDHPLAMYAHLVKGINLGRTFKYITPDKKIRARKPKYDESIKLLNTAVAQTEAGVGLDNITMNMTMRSQAHSQIGLGAPDQAKATMDSMVGYFEKQGLKAYVMRLIKEQAREALK